jgi:hypothetical protein
MIPALSTMHPGVVQHGRRGRFRGGVEVVEVGETPAKLAHRP